MNQTTVLQYLKNVSQKIRDWIADRLATMPPKDTLTAGRLAATRVTKTEAANTFARALKTGSTRDAMRVPVTLQTTQKKVPVEAFLDCGANECFVSQQFINDYRLGVRYMKTPRKLENANGSSNAGGSLCYYTELEVATGGFTHLLCFYITDMGPDDLILGYPWFTAMNAQPDWKNGTIPDPITIHTLGAASGKPRHTARLAMTTPTPTRPLLEAGEQLYHHTENNRNGNRRLPNRPASSEVQGPNAQDRIHRHSSCCWFLLRGAEKHSSTAMSVGPTDTMTQSQPVVRLPRQTHTLTMHRNC